MQSSHQSRTQSQQEGGDNEGKGKSVGVTLDAALISRLVQRAGHKDVAEVPSLKIQRSNIRALGNAFFRFRSLHTLDLGRNVLVSLRGLQHCTALERLSIYYNKVATLDELLQLRSNSRLSQLDCRLNPMTKAESYRSFAVFHLQALARLDEREIRPIERERAGRVLARSGLQGRRPAEASAGTEAAAATIDTGLPPFSGAETTTAVAANAAPAAPVAAAPAAAPAAAAAAAPRAPAFTAPATKAPESPLGASKVESAKGQGLELAVGELAEITVDVVPTPMKAGDSGKGVEPAPKIAPKVEASTGEPSRPAPTETGFSSQVQVPGAVEDDVDGTLRRVVSMLNTTAATSSATSAAFSGSLDQSRGLSISPTQRQELRGVIRKLINEREAHRIRYQSEISELKRQRDAAVEAERRARQLAAQTVSEAENERMENARLKARLSSMQTELQIAQERSMAGAQMSKMLSEAHASLMEDQKLLREQLMESQAMHEIDAREWKKNFDELLQSYLRVVSPGAKQEQSRNENQKKVRDLRRMHASGKRSKSAKLRRAEQKESDEESATSVLTKLALSSSAATASLAAAVNAAAMSAGDGVPIDLEAMALAAGQAADDEEEGEEVVVEEGAEGESDVKNTSPSSTSQKVDFDELGRTVNEVLEGLGVVSTQKQARREEATEQISFVDEVKLGGGDDEAEDEALQMQEQEDEVEEQHIERQSPLRAVSSLSEQNLFALSQLLKVVKSRKRRLFGKPIVSISGTFDAIDKDGSGTITRDELHAALSRLSGMQLSGEQLEDLVNCFDTDRSGSIDREEFIRTCRGVQERAALKARRSSKKYAKAKIPTHRVTGTSLSPWKAKVNVKAELEKDRKLMERLGLARKSEEKKRKRKRDAPSKGKGGKGKKWTSR